MATPSKYKTKQSAQLLDYLRSTMGTHITASDIGAHFHAQGISMGLATIYRHLDRMVEGGLVNKYHMADATCAYFEYIDREESCHQKTCFHCKCQKCGVLIHLKCGEIEGMQHHLLAGHGFSLDPVHTVLYGLCQSCTTSPTDKTNTLEGI